MKTGSGTGTQGTGTDSRGGDNVVQFPRDWFGPRDELVAIEPPPGFESEGLDRSAEGFWGTGLAEPAVIVPDHREADAGAERRAQATAAQSPSAQWLRTRPPVGRARWAILATAVLALVVLAVVGAMQTPPSAPARRGSRPIADSPQGGGGTLAASIDGGARAVDAIRSDRSYVRRTNGSQVGNAHRARRSRAARHPRHHITTARQARQHRRTDRAAASDHGNGATGDQAASSTQPSPVAPQQPTAEGPPVDHSAPAAGGATASSNRPAYGPDGTLGPGSSPDS